MNSNGLIEAPVGIDADISPVLGVGSDDLGYLCSNQHGKINKWSRFKPLKWNHLDIHMKNDYFNNNDSNEWWKGPNGQCGLIIPYTKQIITKADEYFDGNMSWGYDAPEPNSSEPARALDFDGYNHNAFKPISEENVQTDIWSEDGRIELSWDIAVDSDDYNIRLSDISFETQSDGIQSLTSWYPGLLMRNTTKTITHAITSTSKLGTGNGFTVSFEDNGNWSYGGWMEGKWDVIPFLSPGRIDTTGTQSGVSSSDYSQQYISVDCSPVRITIHAPGTLTWGLTLAYWIEPTSGQYRYAGYEGFITNNSSSEETVRFRISIGYSASNNPWTDFTNVMHTVGGSDGYEITVPPRNNDGTPFVYNFSSEDVGGAYPLLDIGTTQYNIDNYWTVVNIGVSTNTGVQWNAAPAGAWCQVEQPVQEG